MKPKKFMPGQAVTPADKKDWHNEIGDKVIGPVFGEVYTVKKYGPFNKAFKQNMVILVELPAFCIDESCLDPVITTHELESELSEIETRVVV